MGTCNNDCRCCGIGRNGVISQANLVVGFQRCARWCRINIGVQVVIASCIAEHAGLDADGGRACGVGCGGEGSGVDAWADLAPIAKGATGNVNIPLCEVGAGFRERKGNGGGLAGAQRTLVDSDGNGWCRRIWRYRAG